MLLCATLTPLRQAARKLPVQSIPPALRVKFILSYNHVKIQTHVQESLAVSLAIWQRSRDHKHLTPKKRAPRKQG